MKRLRLGLLASAALSLGLSSASLTLHAQTPAQPAAPGSAAAGKDGALQGEDRNFMMKAATGGMAEVRLGELAQSKGSSQEVKQFGAQMVKDHGQANDELKRIAAAKGVQLPTELDREHRQLMEKLQALSGAQFDREYVKAMLDAHKKDVALFEQQVRAGRNADTRAFAEKTLPTLRQHLTHVQTLDRAISAPARAGSPGSP
jgi:putative membrane protein